MLIRYANFPTIVTAVVKVIFHPSFWFFQRVPFHFTINSAHHFMLSGYNSPALQPTFVAYTHWFPSLKTVLYLQSHGLWPSSFACIPLANSPPTVGSGPASTFKSNTSFMSHTLQGNSSPNLKLQIQNSIQQMSLQIGSLFTHLIWNMYKSQAWEISLTLPCLPVGGSGLSPYRTIISFISRWSLRFHSYHFTYKLIFGSGVCPSTKSKPAERMVSLTHSISKNLWWFPHHWWY